MIVQVNIILKGTVYTPNCSNVVLKNEKRKKAKQELMRIIKPHSQGGFICSRRISPLECCFFLLFFSYKTIANSNRQIRRLCADAANEFIRLISLTNSYLAFSFFLFSMTTFLQICVYIYNLIDQSSPSCSKGG